jgi:MFS family permease
MNKKDNADQNFQEATEQPKIGKEQPATPPSIPAHPLSLLPRIRSNLLYTTLCIALSLDTLSTSSMLASTEIIAADIGLTEGGNAIWIVSSSAMAFAAFIPLGGRLADVLSPRWWFVGGFVGMAALTLGNSFGEFETRF